MIVTDKFANIENYEDIREVVESKNEISVKEESGFWIVSYMFSDSNTFDSLEALECRGITFNASDGSIAARPVHKFFNVGEKQETLIENLKNFSIQEVQEKDDGSMIHPVLDKTAPYGVNFKTKKSFISDVALLAKEYIYEYNPGNIINLSKDCLNVGLTPTFEFVSPKNRIVVKYEDTEFRFLHLRRNISGEYMNNNFVDFLAEDYGISRPSFCSNFQKIAVEDGIESLRKEISEMEDFEGVVIQFTSGEMVKMKTPWYLRFHRAISFIRERDIAEMVVDGTLDDTKSLISEMGESLEPIEEIEHRVLSQISEIQNEVNSVLEESGHKSQKEFAIENKQHPYFSLIMAAYQGKTPDYIGFWKRNFLKEKFSLNPVI